MREKIEAYIQTRISSPIESILLKEALDEPMIESINRLNDPALFFVVNNLYLNPTKVADPVTLARSLSPLIDVPDETIQSACVLKKRRHLEILRKMSIMTRDMVKKRIDTEK
jgi:hypothetical protein